MHFSIPDTSESSGKTSSSQQSYTLYNIHVNGYHHCSLRYSQLRTFNDELQNLSPAAMTNIESFPPKKLFSLSAKEIDERRISLENYLQSIVKNKYILTSSYFNEFFLNAQIETFENDSTDRNQRIDLTICLLNNHEIIVENILINDTKSHLLDECANKIQLQDDFIPYFSLYLYEQKDNNFVMFRPLYDFESPYLSLKQAKRNHEQSYIVLKKSYWDPDFDLQLIDDRRARNLLFVQARHEMELCHNFYINDIYPQLESLRENNSFKDYLLLARTSKFYGHIIVQSCSIVYPFDDTTKQKLSLCSLAIGNNEILCCINNDNKKTNEPFSFKVSRIRSWKVRWLKQDMNISLEYLFRKDTLKWITIHTEQAPLVNHLLQSMVDEILSKREGATSPIWNPSVTAVSSVKEETPSLKGMNGIAMRRESDLNRFNNNDLFDRGDGDDDL